MPASCPTAQRSCQPRMCVPKPPQFGHEAKSDSRRAKELNERADCEDKEEADKDTEPSCEDRLAAGAQRLHADAPEGDEPNRVGSNMAENGVAGSLCESVQK